MLVSSQKSSPFNTERERDQMRKSIFFFIIIIVIVIIFIILISKGDRIHDLQLLSNDNNNDDVLILSVATLNNSGVRNIINTMRKFGYNYKILGMGNSWEGFITKAKLYSEALAKLDPSQITVCVDAYDVLVSRTPKGFVEKFLDLSNGAGKMVFGLERHCGGNCIPIDSWWEKHYPLPPPLTNKFINSGCVVGRAHDLFLVFNWMVQTHQKDDQIGLVTYALDHPDSWVPDINNVLICNHVLGDDESLSKSSYFHHYPGIMNDKIYNKTTTELLGTSASPMKKIPLIIKTFIHNFVFK